VTSGDTSETYLIEREVVMCLHTISVRWLQLIACLCGFTIASATLATDRPGWIDVIPKDKLFYYTVGVAEDASLAQAMQLAERRAWEQMVEVVLGISGVVNQQEKTTLETGTLKKEVEFSSDIVALRGLQTEGSYSEQAGQVYRAFVLRKFPIVQAERLRTKWNKAGGTRLLSRLSVSSVPDGAKVELDREPLGVTPVSVLLPPRVTQLQ